MLYLCPSPIGNLEDISLRTLRVLNEVDYIACEDTRVSQKLLNHYDIKKPLISYHKFNERSKIDQIIDLLSSGKDLAYLTDAGSPGISDPGSYLVRVCIEKNLDFEALPGPTALIPALVLSGLDTERFTFIGFLPQKSSRRKKDLEAIKTLDHSLIFYEAPHRVKACLRDMYEVMGPRKIALVRELTKVYEEVIRRDLGDLVQDLDSLTIKGEFVLVLEGARQEDLADDIDIEAELIHLIAQGQTKSQAVKTLAKEYDLSRNEVYQRSLKI